MKAVDFEDSHVRKLSRSFTCHKFCFTFWVKCFWADVLKCRLTKMPGLCTQTSVFAALFKCGSLQNLWRAEDGSERAGDLKDDANSNLGLNEVCFHN